MMTLDNFETHIPEKIIQRGFDYYLDGTVKKVEQIDKGVFGAIVRGTEKYEVTVCLTKKTIDSHKCSCPYTWGDTCKHVVALLYYLRNSEKWKEPATLSAIEKMKTILRDLDQKDLIVFMLKQAQKDRTFRKKFFKKFGKKSE